MANGDSEHAVDFFKEAIRHTPPTFELDPQEDCLAEAYLRLGMYDDAVAEYGRILQLNPNYPLARFYLGQALGGLNQADQARESYRLFLESWKDADEDIPEVAKAREALAN